MTARMLAQRQPSFEDRVTAHWPRTPAPKMIGTQADSRRRGTSSLRRRSVGERRTRGEAGAGATVERVRATMQASVTTRRVRIPPTANPRFPGPGSSPRGKPGPKARPKGVAEGERVNIPAPGHGERMVTPPTPAAVRQDGGAAVRRPPRGGRRAGRGGREKPCAC